MKRIKISAFPSIVFEGTQYPPGTYLVTSQFVMKEPGEGFVYHEDGKRLTDKTAVGVISPYTAGQLLHNWPDSVEMAKSRSKRKAKAK